MAEIDIKTTTIATVPNVNVTDRCSRLLGMLCWASSPIDPRAIRALTFLVDKVDVSGSSIDVTDRCSRLLGQLCSAQGGAIDPRDRNWTLDFLTDQVDITGSSVDVTDRCSRLLGQLCAKGFPIDPRDRNWLLTCTDQIDVCDRAARLVGIIYGSQSQQLLQRALTFDLQTQLRTNGTEYDARQIRALLSSDIVTAYGSQIQPLQQKAGTFELLTDPVDRCGRLLGQLCAPQGGAIDPRDRNWDLNFANDQADVTGSYVTAVNAPLTPIIDYDTATIGTSLSYTHNYVATGNFRLSSVQVSASGATKIEIKSGAVNFETTKMVSFTTESNLTVQLRFHEELQLTIGQRLQVIITNRELQNMDTYSTIMGFNT